MCKITAHYLHFDLLTFVEIKFSCKNKQSLCSGHVIKADYAYVITLKKHILVNLGQFYNEIHSHYIHKTRTYTRTRTLNLEFL